MIGSLSHITINALTHVSRLELVLTETSPCAFFEFSSTGKCYQWALFHPSSFESLRNSLILKKSLISTISAP